MNISKLGIIISREYLNKVKKKSFLIITFVVPVLFVLLCILPTIIMMATKEEGKTVAVVDKSGIVMPTLKDSESLHYIDLSTEDPDAVKNSMSAYGADILLSISPLDTENKSVTARTYSAKPLGMDASSSLERRINDAVETYRIQSYDIENLEEIMASVKPDIHLYSFTLGEDGKETISESGIFMAISMLLGMGIYMFIALSSGMVMTSVIEEKSSRVVEVLVSSVKATELMFGKIIGVALVALTQFFLWIVLSLGILALVWGFIGKDKVNEMMQGTTKVAEMGTSVPGIDTDTMAVLDPSALSATEEVGDDDLSVVIGTLSSVNFGQIGIAFLLYFVFGYLLYSTLFAAIGSSAESTEDTQQLQIPVTIPLMIGFFVALYTFKAPDSQIAFWFSMFPFTSPIVMLARIPFGVAAWELIVSIVLLIATFIAGAWFSAKIYKVGILMYGKKSTFKDLWKWFRQN